MSEWREVALGDSVDILHGYAFRGEHFCDEGELIVLTPGNFRDEGGFKPKNGKEKYYNGPVPPRFLLNKGDVVIAMTEQARGLLGSSATVPKDGVYLHNQRIGLVRVTDPNSLDLRFLYHLMNCAPVRDQIQATATGSKVRHTAPERIRAVRARVPDLSVQRAVAAVLDAIDDLIDNNLRQSGILEDLARRIYREWFVHFRYPGHEDVPLVDSVLGLIPHGWRVSTCGEELTALGGGTPSKKERAYWDGGDIPWFTPSDLTKSAWRYTAQPEMTITAEGLSRSSARLFPAGSVLMTSRATLGVLAIATFDATTNQGFIVVLPDDRWSSGFLREWLDFHAVELETIATGATFKEITKGAFKRVPFLVPDQRVLNAHRSITGPLELQIQLLEEQIRNLVDLRDILLPKLVTGQIDVSHIDPEALAEAATA